MEAATGILRGLAFAAEASTVGFCVAGVWAPSRLRPTLCVRLDALAKAFSLVAIVAVLATLPPRAATMVGKPLLDLGANDLWVVGGQTWIGRVWCLQTGLMSLAFLLILSGRRSGGAIAAAALAFGTLSSHSTAGGGAIAITLANATHIIAATLWFGGLLPLVVIRFSAGGDEFRQALTGFSAIALPLMIVMIATGLVLAVAQVGSWPGLFGTDYGSILLVKSTAVAIVLLAAAGLRTLIGSRSRLDSSRSKSGMSRSGFSWSGFSWSGFSWYGFDWSGYRSNHSWSGYVLVLDYAAATTIVFAAGLLGQTSPALHGDVVWHFSFRFAPQLAWKNPANQQSIYAGAAVSIVAFCFATAMRLRGSRRIAAMAAVSGCMIGSAVALPAITVPAFPATFDRSPLGYDATNIVAGQTRFLETCWPCHGRTGRGNGPEARTMRPAPADLTAPHLGDHTMGDMFWWVSNGYAGSAMPGFAPALSADERWRLITYVMALSLGYQSRLIGPEIAPAFAWLPAIDFPIPARESVPSQNATTDQEADETLLGRRGLSSKLVVFLSPSAAHDLHAISDLTRLDHVDIVLVLAPGVERADLNLPQNGPSMRVVNDRHGAIASAWALYRRSLVHPGFDDNDALPRVVAFLVDRFGYVRARWRDDEDCPVFDVASLTRQLQDLSSEPDLNGPDAHVH